LSFLEGDFRSLAKQAVNFFIDADIHETEIHVMREIVRVVEVVQSGIYKESILDRGEIPPHRVLADVIRASEMCMEKKKLFCVNLKEGRFRDSLWKDLGFKLGGGEYEKLL